MGNLSEQGIDAMIDDHRELMAASLEERRRLEELVNDVRNKNTQLEIDNRALREKLKGTFVALRQANIARNKEWDRADAVGAFWRASEMAGEAGELGEALLVCLQTMIAVGKVNNTVKKLERERLGIRGSRTDMAALGRELADVIITTDLAAMHYGVDLWGSTRDTFNATSDKQGLKTHLE